jgi:hypothetical protein
MCCCLVRLLLVAMLATQHTDFESFTNALGTLPNQPPVPMACEPSPMAGGVTPQDFLPPQDFPHRNFLRS